MSTIPPISYVTWLSTFLEATLIFAAINMIAFGVQHGAATYVAKCEGAFKKQMDAHDAEKKVTGTEKKSRPKLGLLAKLLKPVSDIDWIMRMVMPLVYGIFYGVHFADAADPVAEPAWA